MNISSPHDVSYNARWTRGYLEVFQDGKSIGKVRISTRETAKEVFEVVVKNQSSLQDVAYFHEIAQGMVGLDLSKMRYSEDRQTVLYQGQFFADAEVTTDSHVIHQSCGK